MTTSFILKSTRHSATKTFSYKYLQLQIPPATNFYSYIGPSATKTFPLHSHHYTSDWTCKDSVNCETTNCIYYWKCKKNNCKEYPTCIYIETVHNPARRAYTEHKNWYIDKRSGFQFNQQWHTNPTKFWSSCAKS